MSNKEFLEKMAKAVIEYENINGGFIVGSYFVINGVTYEFDGEKYVLNTSVLSFS